MNTKKETEPIAKDMAGQWAIYFLKQLEEKLTGKEKVDRLLRDQ